LTDISFQAQKWLDTEVAAKMEPLLKIRQRTMQLLEEARNQKWALYLASPA
jgi:hypothetical protein